jgi:hypothetical protein
MNDDFNSKIDQILRTFEDYIECEEWHIHDDSSEHEGDTPFDTHREYDNEKAKQAIISLIKSDVIGEVRDYKKHEICPVCHDYQYSCGCHDAEERLLISQLAILDGGKKK